MTGGLIAAPVTADSRPGSPAASWGVMVWGISRFRKMSQGALGRHLHDRPFCVAARRGVTGKWIGRSAGMAEGSQLPVVKATFMTRMAVHIGAALGPNGPPSPSNLHLPWGMVGASTKGDRPEIEKRNGQQMVLSQIRRKEKQAGPRPHVRPNSRDKSDSGAPKAFSLLFRQTHPHPEGAGVGAAFSKDGQTRTGFVCAALETALRGLLLRMRWCASGGAGTKRALVKAS